MWTDRLRTALLLAAMGLLVVRFASAGDGPATGWAPTAAADYLDARQKAWSEDFHAADRGEGTGKTSCISCHTVLPYALARPALRKLAGVAAPTRYETRVVEQVKTRVANWAVLDTEAFSLLYDFNAEKKVESRGTEAVLNAVVLAFDDRDQGRRTPSAITRTAFDRLWETQRNEGASKGSWDWLSFGLDPWESIHAPYFGAALAAIAVGTAPGYSTSGADPVVDARVNLLRGYLKDNLAAQNDHNRLWMLWASTKLAGLLDDPGRDQIVARIASKRNDDGGWCLSSLGSFTRSDGTPQDTSSDGYATGLVLHVFQNAGIGREDPRVRPGLAWLRANQKPSGAWEGTSVNKRREPGSANWTKAFVGKFMGDAATAYAALALSHPG